MPLSVRSSTDEGTDPKCARRDAPSDSITVAHYPTGASKWNPIEHRLFSEISKDWAAEPLDSYPKVLNFIRNTCTRTGLAVSAYLDRRQYPTGTSPDPEHVRRLCLKQTFDFAHLELYACSNVNLLLRQPLGKYLSLDGPGGISDQIRAVAHVFRGWFPWSGASPQPQWASAVLSVGCLAGRAPAVRRGA
jgi:hypothetical protein